MTNGKDMSHLAEELIGARAEFYEAMERLEVFRAEWPGQEYTNPYKLHYISLEQNVARTAKKYKQAWVHYMACQNGWRLHRPYGGIKTTEAFVTPVPVQEQMEIADLSEPWEGLPD